jgi:energy-coupling factor transporter ATP-binding protein EcfA2
MSNVGMAGNDGGSKALARSRTNGPLATPGGMFTGISLRRFFHAFDVAPVLYSRDLCYTLNSGRGTDEDQTNEDGRRRKCMILQKIAYSEKNKQSTSWLLNELRLQKINLLVGKNATGKTRTINAISRLIDLLLGKKVSFPQSSYYSIEFLFDCEIYNYILNIENSRVLEEKLTINGAEKLKRNGNGKGKIWYSETNGTIDFQIPSDKLAIVSRWGDNIQHPYLEKLYNWVNAAIKYEFGKIFDKDVGLPIVDLIIDTNNFDPHGITDPIWALLAGLQEFGADFQNRIIKFMKNLNYQIDGITVAPNPYLSEMWPVYTLQVNEVDRDCVLYQQEMSQGMFSTLALIILVVYHTMKKSASTILIDDIGEGLDYDRSAKLINLLIELAEKNDNIQLIMSTNDRFVMNNVPLEYWQVIQRSGSECKVFNYQNSKEKFDEFKYMGLNNFDFLATDFINTTWEKA